MLNDIIMMFSS